jgi:hypothetical protein
MFITEKMNTSIEYTWCGYEVPRIILLQNLKGTMQLDHGKDICAYFNLHYSQFQCINASCVEVVLKTSVFLCLFTKTSDQF